VRGQIGLGLLAAVAAGSLLAATSASADRGVSIDVAGINILQDLHSGGGYRLPTVGVRNPGTERADYKLGVSYIEGQKRKRPSAEWFRFAPKQLTLEPGKTRAVSVRLVLPTGADPGDYEALLGAQIISDRQGAQVGATAAAPLRFTIAPSTLLAAWWLRVKTLFGDWSPWSYLVPGLALIGAALYQLRRRLTISVARRA
jgi:hypothetical protein